MKKILFTISVVLIFIVSACGASDYDRGYDNDSDYNGDSPGETIDDKFPDDQVVDLSNTPELANRKIIYKVDMGIVGTDLNAIYTAINAQLTTNEAYIESENITTSSYVITYRVKSVNLDQFITVIQDQGEIIHYKKTSEDITNSYSTFQARLAALETQHARILELMDQAADIDEMLKLEAMLADIESDLNEIGNTLENYDSLVDYSTVNVVIDKIGNLQDLLPTTERPYLYDRTIESNSATFIFENNNVNAKTFRVVLWHKGEIVETEERTLAPYSQLEVTFENLENNEKYLLLAFQTEDDHAESIAYRNNFQTEETFFGTTGTIFITSVSFLGTMIEYGFYVLVALFPFLVLTAAIVVPIRIYYVKKIKSRP